MALDRHDMDLKVMARRLLHDLVRSDYAGELWESFAPDIGEHDWLAILEKAKEATEELNPPADVFTSTYGRLERRAESAFEESEVIGTL